MTIYTEADRHRANKYVKDAPIGTRLEFKTTKRSLPQNSLLWSMLSDIAAQKEHAGRKYTPNQWKVLMLNAIGQEVQFIPALDNKAFIPWGQSSSDLSREEMTALIDFMECWGAENGVRFHGKPEQPPIPESARPL